MNRALGLAVAGGVVLAALGLTYLLRPPPSNAAAPAAPASSDLAKRRNLLDKVDPAVRARTGSGRTTRVIIVLKPSAGSPIEANRRIADRMAAPLKPYFRQIGRLPLIAAPADEATLVALDASDDVERVVPDNIARPTVDNTSRVARQVRAHGLWTQDATTKPASVAILDTGIDASHSYFRHEQGTTSRVTEQLCFSTSDGQRASLCRDGTARDITSENAATPTNLSIAHHGTMVAGVAAGWNGQPGGCRIDGIGRRANIVAVQVYTQLSGAECPGGEGTCIGSFESAQTAALEYLLDNRVALNLAAVNMSLAEEKEGKGSQEDACDDEEPKGRKYWIDRLLAAGIPTVIAAGNIEAAYGASKPGCISTAITVGAVTPGNFPTFSAGRLVDLMAPGACFAAAIPSGGYTATEMGTSLAAPFVAGAIASLRSGETPPSSERVTAALLDGAATVTDCRSLQPRRLLDLEGALAQLALPAPPGAGPGGSPPTGGSGAPPLPGPGTSPPVSQPGGPAPGAVTRRVANDCNETDPSVCPNPCEAPTP